MHSPSLKSLNFIQALQPAMASPTIPDAKPFSSVKSVAVVGGGVSGLAAAYKLKLNGLRVTLFEAEERAGGKIRSNSYNGLIWDEGANTMTESEMDVGRLIDELGLREKQQFPISQTKRYIAKDGLPVLIPSNPVALIKSNILSPQSKLKLFLEPFLWKRFSSKVSEEFSHESVGHFFQRHFGAEVVDYFVDPFVAGSSGGDPESLSMRHAFPELWSLEKRFGSVIVGAIRSKFSAKDKNSETRKPSGKTKRQRGSFSFHGGMQTLTDMLCTKIGGDNLKLNSKVLSLACNCEEGSPFSSWSISYAAKHDDHKTLIDNQPYDAVIMTAPLCNVQDMKFTKIGKPFVLDFIPKVSYLPLSVIVTSFRKDCVKRPLEGFGVLVPSREQRNGLKTLGTLFSSMMFPDRATSDHFLYTTFVGGSRNRDLAGASSEELKQVVTSDLQQLLGVEGQPGLKLDNNPLSQIPSNGFEALRKLEILDLTGNPSSLPDPPLFSALPQLQELYLRRMQLQEVPPGLLSLHQLRILDLSQNCLTSLPKEVKHLTSLTELDLTDNNISALPPELGLLEPSLQALRLDGNPLRSIRRPILDRGTKAVLNYLKDKIPEP